MTMRGWVSMSWLRYLNPWQHRRTARAYAALRVPLAMILQETYGNNRITVTPQLLMAWLEKARSAETGKLPKRKDT